MASRRVLHKSWVKANAFGGTTYTTQCNRVSGRGADGMNIADSDAEVTCKFCLQIIAEGRARPDRVPA